MASLASLLEDFRNYRGVQDWNLGRQEDQMLGHSEQARGLWQLLQGLGVGDVAGIGAIKAYHGSPHLFDKFDMSKIGTGEGAQAYGHGLYFAESPDVATQYRDALSAGELRLKGGGEYDPTNINHFAAAELLNYGGDKLKAISDIQKSIKQLAQIKSSWRDSAIDQKKSLINAIIKGDLPELEEISHGNLYQTSLEWPDAAREAADPMGPQHFLDWDKPIQEQPESIRSLVERYKRSLQSTNNPYIPNALNTTGDVLQYARAALQSNPEQELKALGIPGIRYLDQGSRGAGEGTANYVVFDDRIPRIVARNGVPVRGLKGIVGQ